MIEVLQDMKWYELGLIIFPLIMIITSIYYGNITLILLGITIIILNIDSYKKRKTIEEGRKLSTKLYLMLFDEEVLKLEDLKKSRECYKKEKKIKNEKND